MEDAHTTLTSTREDPNASYFAVYDGHGGSSVARYAGEHLHHRVMGDPAYAGGDVPLALKNGFLGLDEDILSTNKHEGSGCTSVVSVLRDDVVYCGNAGDSRGLLSFRGVADPLSHDHKPMNQSERKRIEAAGGFVDYGRVNGNLALSRALGDFEFKGNVGLPPESQIVTADPEVIQKQLKEDHEFMVLACDGIWDVMSNQEVVDFVREKIGLGEELPKICEDIMDRCLAPECRMGGVGCDNMTVVIVGFLPPGGTYTDLAAKCRRGGVVR